MGTVGQYENDGGSHKADDNLTDVQNDGSEHDGRFPVKHGSQ